LLAFVRRGDYVGIARKRNRLHVRADPIMLILGIETSCDETAAALVDDRRTVRAEAILSQIAEHTPFGGVVPEIAARSHLVHLDGLIGRVMAEAKVDFSKLAGIAATGGPGLIGGLIVGTTMAKAIALVHSLPFLAINHLEGHALSARLIEEIDFPYLLLLVSGGHCQLLIVEGVGRYSRLGGTVDDAVGEAFDKTAKLLGLGYPGGPAIEQAARRGNPKRFALPRPMVGRPDANFSFSGLKTAVRHAVASLGTLSQQDVADLSASFQAAVGDSIVDRTRQAFRMFRDRHADPITLVVAGGVAANDALRKQLMALSAENGARLVAPPLKYCTDNGAMIAWAGVERLRLGLVDGLDFAPRPRWPLDSLAGPVLQR
jgi:N6-L-threonylcarbamoyladenine synthase